MTRKEILAAAEKCVCGDREQDHGSPENNFRLIAEFWHTYLSAKCVACYHNTCVAVIITCCK